MDYVMLKWNYVLIFIQGRHHLSSSTIRLARFQNGKFGSRIKKVIDAKIEAKQNYGQNELRPASHLLRAVAFTAAVYLLIF
jgi:hypothetical protein